ncbi:uncharacterized protein [Nicotiana sylvestris]|uniref:uncharacterized protein n=1 Tax=Nicotiana sylvestris TaxID=4096 RepID=UPI00388CCF89
MTALGFQEVMGRMLRFMDTMTWDDLFPADPATSQAGGGTQTLTTQAPGHAAVVYQTPGALPTDGAQPVAAVVPEPRPAANGDPQKLLDRWTRLNPPIFGGSTYSYVSSLLAHFMVIPPAPLGTSIHVSTLVGDSVVVDWIYRSCMVTFCGFENRVDLLLLDMIDLEIILGMDWLSPYHTVLDCHAKTVTLAMLGLPRLEWNGSTVDTSS